MRGPDKLRQPEGLGCVSVTCCYNTSETYVLLHSWLPQECYCSHCKKCWPPNSKGYHLICQWLLLEFSPCWYKSTTFFTVCIRGELLYIPKHFMCVWWHTGCVLFLLMFKAAVVVRGVWYFPADYTCCEQSHDVTWCLCNICIRMKTESNPPHFSLSNSKSDFWSLVWNILLCVLTEVFLNYQSFKNC